VAAELAEAPLVDAGLTGWVLASMGEG
jgi:hypothetical protein